MRKNIILIFIIFIASFLRLWQLGNVPPSPDWDEAALGYNAYSILQTGKDEYGDFLPVVLKSFNDYKPALYAYVAVPTVKLFGLSTFAVRVPAAIFGIITVIAVYFLVKELFKKEKLALLTSFLLAISPWHVQFSRVAFESGLGLTLNILTALFFVKGLKKHWLLSLSAVFAALSLYSYQSEKVFVPILILILIVTFRRELLSIPKKYLALCVISGLIVGAPFINYTLNNPQSLNRAKSTLVFSNKSVFLENNVKRVHRDRQSGNLLSAALNNRRLLYLRSGVSGYLSHFDLNWLFIKGDQSRHHAPGMGLLYLFELPFLLVGIYTMFFHRDFIKLRKKETAFIFAWFMSAPIPAALTADVPHAVRTLNFLPTFQIFTAIGIITFFTFISNIKYQISKINIKYLIFSLFFLFFIFNFLYYLNQYFVQQNYFHSQDWQSGYREAIEFINKHEDKYEKIVVGNQGTLDQSHIFFAFYNKYPPIEYQQNQRIEKYEFRKIIWSNEDKRGTILYIGSPADFDRDARVIKTIYYQNGTPAIKIVEG